MKARTDATDKLETKIFLNLAGNLMKRKLQNFKKLRISIINEFLFIFFHHQISRAFKLAKFCIRCSCGCRLKSNCPLVRLGTIDDMPSVGVFLRDPNPYLREFRRKHGKLRKTKSNN